MDELAVVVVGVDGSTESRLALEYAARRAATLRVVSVFESAGVFGARYGIPIPVSDEQIAKRVDAEMTALVDEAVKGLSERPHVQLSVQAGSAGRVLVEESKTADLLVVGHRGLGAITGALLGSVSMYCVLHAHCSVLVVRPTGPEH